MSEPALAVRRRTKPGQPPHLLTSPKRAPTITDPPTLAGTPLPPTPANTPLTPVTLFCIPRFQVFLVKIANSWFAWGQRSSFRVRVNNSNNNMEEMSKYSRFFHNSSFR